MKVSFYNRIYLLSGIFCYFLSLTLHSGNLQITLEIDGLDETLEVDSVEWGVKNDSTYMDPQQPEFDDVSFASILSKSSPDLFQRTASGKHYPIAKLSFYEAGQSNPFYEIELETVFVSSASIETSNEEIHQEISLYYLNIQWTYHSLDNEGEIDQSYQTGWDIPSNAPW